MRANDISQAISRAIEDRRLLSHPFYQRWENGELDLAELTTYAEQYRQIEQVLPEVLEEIASQLPDGVSRRLVEENLTDERSNPRPHIELFESFADSVKAKTAVPAATGTLGVVECYQESAKAGPVRALATLAAYEVQGAEIATSKSDGLRRHYGLDETATAFWDVHGAMESDHAKWSVDALAALDADPAEVYTAARQSADAWWAFLDEREAAACA